MYLNGAAETIALDVSQSPAARAAEALADLLCDCIFTPADWHLSDVGRSDFLSRLGAFNFRALQCGDLDAGLLDIPMKHVITDICEPELPPRSIDIMASRAVLEHFLDFPRAVSAMFEIMSPGGVAFHHIDLADHRARTRPDLYHYWSFLEEDDDWTDGFVNRLRSSEIKRFLVEAGFDILNYQNRHQELPSGFRESIRGRFRYMDDEDLETTGVSVILQRPR